MGFFFDLQFMISKADNQKFHIHQVDLINYCELKSVIDMKYFEVKRYGVLTQLN